jgi:hypothetical protein
VNCPVRRTAGTNQAFERSQGTRVGHEVRRDRSRPNDWARVVILHLIAHVITHMVADVYGSSAMKRARLIAWATCS